jgi:hypothetical protein
VFSWIEFSVSGINIPAIKVFRLLRTLRPLRLITHNIQMKIVVIALLESISGIVNVIIVVILIWLMFSILGVSLFSGKYWHCENIMHWNKIDCEEHNYAWKNADSNFDNVLNAMMTLFVVSSLEGWPEIMLRAVDGTDDVDRTVKNNAPEAAYFFVLFILIGSFFFLNLFVAVVFDSFN